MGKNNNKNQVLIMLPAYDLLEYTKSLMATIRCSSKHYLLLCDNGSTDKTGEYFKEYAQKESVFAALFEKNIGCAGIWNIGMEYGFKNLGCSKVIILNNDSLLLPDTIDRIVDDLNKLDVGIASGTNISGKLPSPEAFSKTKNGAQGKYNESPDFSCFGINKNCYDKIGLFDEAFYPAYYEDNDYHYRMGLGKLKAICNLGNYYYHFGSRTCQINEEYMNYIKWRYIKNRNYYVQKWGGEPGEEIWTDPFNGSPPEDIELLGFEEYKKDK